MFFCSDYSSPFLSWQATALCWALPEVLSATVPVQGSKWRPICPPAASCSRLPAAWTEGMGPGPPLGLPWQHLPRPQYQPCLPALLALLLALFLQYTGQCQCSPMSPLAHAFVPPCIPSNSCKFKYVPAACMWSSILLASQTQRLAVMLSGSVCWSQSLNQNFSWIVF